jgi:hypothetical protein
MLKRIAGIAIILILFGIKLQAQDSTLMLQRQFDKDQIEQLVQQEKYQYEIPAKAPIGLWERLMWFLKKWFNQVFKKTTSNTTVRYIVLIAVIFIAVLQLLRANFGSVLGKDSQAFQHSVYIQKQDPFVIDYDKQLQDAENTQNYREAVRLWHLKTLKALHHAGLIRWKNYKTNADFAYEIGISDKQVPFKKLIRFFEYVWYGEFQLKEEHYQEISQNYQQFIEKLMQNTHE